VIKIDPHIQLTVRDQDEALAFYTDKLGMEVRIDAPQPGFRWLTVGPPGQPEVAIVLAAANGSGGGGTLFLASDDALADCKELEARGVEFVQPPTEEQWGISAGFSDPSGNYIRLTQGQ
jgi:predicted enzyme related to lactoylglutathione lyase